MLSDSHLLSDGGLNSRCRGIDQSSNGSSNCRLAGLQRWPWAIVEMKRVLISFGGWWRGGGSEPEIRDAPGCAGRGRRCLATSRLVINLSVVTWLHIKVRKKQTNNKVFNPLWTCQRKRNSPCQLHSSFLQQATTGFSCVLLAGSDPW